MLNIIREAVSTMSHWHASLDYILQHSVDSNVVHAVQAVHRRTNFEYSESLFTLTTEDNEVSPYTISCCLLPVLQLVYVHTSPQEELDNTLQLMRAVSTLLAAISEKMESLRQIRDVYNSACKLVLVKCERMNSDLASQVEALDLKVCGGIVKK